MKKLFICLAAVAMSVGAYAQNFTWGVRAGMNISSFSASNGDRTSSFKSKVGFNAGLMADYALSDKFSVESGLYFSQLGAKAKSEFEEGSTKATINIGYLQLPLLATYKLAISDNAKWSIQAGPYFALGLGAKMKYEMTYDGETEKSEMDIFCEGDEERGVLQKFDMGLAFGTGVTFSKIYVGVKYDLGLSNIFCKEEQKEGSKFKNGNFSVNVGYNF